MPSPCSKVTEKTILYFIVLYFTLHCIFTVSMQNQSGRFFLLQILFLISAKDCRAYISIGLVVAPHIFPILSWRGRPEATKHLQHYKSTLKRNISCSALYISLFATFQQSECSQFLTLAWNWSVHSSSSGRWKFSEMIFRPFNVTAKQPLAHNYVQRLIAEAGFLFKDYKNHNTLYV